MAELFLLGIGILGVVNFVADWRRKRLRWWDWPALAVFLLMIAQSVCAWLCPQVLGRIYG